VYEGCVALKSSWFHYGTYRVGLLRSTNHHPPAIQRTDQQSSAYAINQQTTSTSWVKFTKRTVSTEKQEMAQPVTSYRKRRFGYLNIFRAKTKNENPTPRHLDPSTTSSPIKRIPTHTITLTDTLSQAHKHTGSQTHSLTPLSSTPKRLKGGPTTQSFKPKHQPVASQLPTGDYSNCAQASTSPHLHITHTVEATARSDTSPITQPSLLRQTHCSRRSINQPQLK
jgi:hypothetical protein